MSHYCMLVVGDNVDAQLAPYQENNMGDCPREYLVFEDKEETTREEYNTTKAAAVKMPDGTYKSQYDYCFKKDSNFKTIYPEGSELVDIEVNILYPTFENYAEHHHEFTKDEEMGKYGYWHNPNSKWDYYVIGGRWNGLFISKLDGNSYSSMRKGDIDWEAMKAAKKKGYEQTYDEWVNYNYNSPEDRQRYAGIYGILNEKSLLLEKWKTIKNDSSLSIDQKCKVLRAIKDYAESESEFVPETKEEYAERLSSEFNTFGYLVNGNWFEKGKMGWWGMVRNEIGVDEWALKFKEFLDSINDNERLTIVDCHI